MATELDRRRTIIGYWRAVEQFEPATVTVPRNGREMKTSYGWCYRIDPGSRSGLLPLLPWEQEHDLGRAAIDPEKNQWRHTVYCGLFRLDRVHDYLAGRYGGDPDYGGARERFAAVCGLVVDHDGRMVDDTVAFSSCAWAAGRILDPGPRPGWLDGWDEAVELCTEAVGLLARTHIPYPQRGAGSRAAPAHGWRKLVRKILGEAAEGAVLGLVGGLTGMVGAVAAGAAQGAVRSVARAVRERSESTAGSGTGPPADAGGGDQQQEQPSRALGLLDLVAFTAHVSHLFGVPEDLVPRGQAPLVVESELLTRRRDGSWRPVSAPFLDSFLVDDLRLVGESDDHGTALARYLDESGPDRARIDVRPNRGEVRVEVLDAVRPVAFPSGCWPADPSKPLVVSQQFAVNQITDELMNRPGLFSVNGPPGTGKTTMLRDLVAAIVVERARRIADLTKPADAFAATPVAWRHEGQRFQVHVPGRDLTGFEIVVASSNNGAVENITAELPGVEAIGDKWRGSASYFAEQASALLDRPAWAAVAAPLGKRDNRGTFAQRFWWGTGNGPDGLHEVLRQAEESGAAGNWAEATKRFRSTFAAEQRLRHAGGRGRRDPLAGDEPELAAPYHDEEWMSARVRVFLAALDLHRTLILQTARIFRTNLLALSKTLQAKPDAPPPEAELAAWRTLFLVVPVVSTTFASCGRMFASLGAESLGWLFVDEAGQAAPQEAVGALWRARRAVMVGDPLQLEPIVQLPRSIQDKLRERYEVSAAWLPSAISAQVAADRANRWGTEVERQHPDREPERVWVGAPLLAHRRCEDPMFTVSNRIAYNEMMVYGTSKQHCPAEKSRWVTVGAGDSNSKWVPEEGRVLTQILEKLHRRHRVPLDQIRVLSPFRDVVTGCRRAIRARRWEDMPPPDGDENAYNEQVDTFIGDRVGTVHTMQGKEADVVILVLGASGRGHARARRWAAGGPNLLNVAVSRARRRLYVIGNYRAWASEPYFATLAGMLELYPWESEHARLHTWHAIPRQTGARAHDLMPERLS